MTLSLNCADWRDWRDDWQDVKRDDWQDDWEEHEWEDTWEDREWEDQSTWDASMEFEMGTEDDSARSNHGPFGWLRAAWSSRFSGRPAQGNTVVGGAEERGKGGSHTSWHRDPQNGDDVGGVGRAVQGKGELQAKGSKGAQ